MQFEPAQIAFYAGLPIGPVRYVLAHKVLWWVRGRPVPGRAGRPRAFHRVDAFWIAVAATLYRQAGLRRPLLAMICDWLESAPWPLPPPRPAAASMLDPSIPMAARDWLYTQARAGARFEVGDLTLLRVRGPGVDTRWVDPDTWKRVKPVHEPQTVLRQDLLELGLAFGT
jgi:hypothetical protein